MLSAFSITQRGESHVKHGLPCQDSGLSFAIPSEGDAEYVVAVVADGVGSEEFSDWGSKAAVEAAAESIRVSLEVDGQMEVGQSILVEAFEDALDAVLGLAEGMGEPFPKFATTLTAAIFDGSTLWFGHAGDDGLVAMRTDGTYGMVTKRHEGELANSVVPLGARNWQFGEERGVASCVLMTDGVLDYCVKDTSEDDRVYMPFLKPLLWNALKTPEEVEAARADWDSFFSDEAGAFRDAVRDDITLALLSNSEAVEALPEYSFDLEGWHADTERYHEERERRLKEISRERLRSDERYRRLVENGRAYRSTIQLEKVENEQLEEEQTVLDQEPKSSLEDAVTAEEDSSALPKQANRLEGARVPKGKPNSAKCLKTIIEGAATVFEGIMRIGEGIGDAVQNMLKKD